MAKVVLIIQARMTSTRLPGKSMMPLADKPLVYRMVERLKNCKKIDEIVIATSDQREDQVLVELAKKLQVSYFQGNLLDVRDRYLKAAEKGMTERIKEACDHLKSDCDGCTSSVSGLIVFLSSTHADKIADNEFCFFINSFSAIVSFGKQRPP
jgi:spore coat polysaccharide biosynthesis protein SpsF